MRHQHRLLVKLAALIGLGLQMACAAGEAPTFLKPEKRVAPRPGLTWPVAVQPADAPPALPKAGDLQTQTNGLLELVDVALATNPATRQAWQLAQVEAASGNAPRALELFERYLEDAPNGPGVRLARMQIVALGGTLPAAPQRPLGLPPSIQIQ